MRSGRITIEDRSAVVSGETDQPIVLVSQSRVGPQGPPGPPGPPGAVGSLGDIDDVSLGLLEDGDLLKFSSPTNTWINEKPATLVDGGNF